MNRTSTNKDEKGLLSFASLDHDIGVAKCFHGSHPKLHHNHHCMIIDNLSLEATDLKKQKQ